MRPACQNGRSADHQPFEIARPGESGVARISHRAEAVGQHAPTHHPVKRLDSTGDEIIATQRPARAEQGFGQAAGVFREQDFEPGPIRPALWIEQGDELIAGAFELRPGAFELGLDLELFGGAEHDPNQIAGR
jgi:hypothetical protein